MKGKAIVFAIVMTILFCFISNLYEKDYCRLTDNIRGPNCCECCKLDKIRGPDCCNDLECKCESDTDIFSLAMTPFFQFYDFFKDISDESSTENPNQKQTPPPKKVKVKKFKSKHMRR